MKFPSIKEVAEELRLINMNTECEGEEGCDVRLQLYPNGAWVIRTGCVSGDSDHLGYCGAGSVPGVVNGKIQPLNTRDLAKDLIDQVKDSFHQSR